MGKQQRPRPPYKAGMAGDRNLEWMGDMRGQVRRQREDGREKRISRREGRNGCMYVFNNQINTQKKKVKKRRRTKNNFDKDRAGTMTYDSSKTKREETSQRKTGEEMDKVQVCGWANQRVCAKKDEEKASDRSLIIGRDSILRFVEVRMGPHSCRLDPIQMGPA